MSTNESMTESTPEAPVEPMAGGPLIVAPGAAGAIIQPANTEQRESQEAEPAGPGIEGEETVWEGHYSGKNFVGRMIIGALLVALWLLVVLNGWFAGDPGRETGWSVWHVLLGLVVLGYWANLGYRYLRAHRGHHYRLTNRRLFITTGFFRRRVDQLELIRIKDVYIQQSMIGDWLRIGNVVVISSEQTLPKAYLLGINDPRRIMDLVWHHMRIEQSTKTDRVNPV